MDMCITQHVYMQMHRYLCFFYFTLFFETGIPCSFGACSGTSSSLPGWSQTLREFSAFRVLGLTV